MNGADGHDDYAAFDNVHQGWTHRVVVPTVVAIPTVDSCELDRVEVRSLKN